MTESEMLGVLLGKKVYDEVKDKINARDCVDVMKAIIMSEFGVIDESGKNVLSERLKTEIREELKHAILNIFFEELSNQEFFQECLSNAIAKSKVHEFIDDLNDECEMHDNKDTKKCKKCSCAGQSKKTKEDETNVTEEDEVAVIVTEFLEKFMGKTPSEEDINRIKSAYEVLSKIFEEDDSEK